MIINLAIKHTLCQLEDKGGPRLPADPAASRKPQAASRKPQAASHFLSSSSFVKYPTPKKQDFPAIFLETLSANFRVKFPPKTPQAFDPQFADFPQNLLDTLPKSTDWGSKALDSPPESKTFNPKVSDSRPQVLTFITKSLESPAKPGDSPPKSLDSRKKSLDSPPKSLKIKEKQRRNLT
jgi:hypothetical protein